MFLIVLLAGCSEIEDVKDAVDGLVNPLVFEGLVLDVTPPADDRIDLSSTGFESGAVALVQLADAAEVADLASAPVGGAAVQFLSGTSGGVVLSEEGVGSYSADSSDGLVYSPGEQATVKMAFGGEESSVVFLLPPIADAAIPESAPPGQSLGINVNGQDFDNLFVVVLDGSTGETTFDNRPDGIEDFYNLTHGSGSLAVEVPAGALSRETLYFIGVAGLTNADSGDIENANTVLSAFMGGRMTFSVLSTLPPG